MKDYHINILFSEDDEGFIADIPDLEACSAFGDTPEVALREVLIANEAWLAGAASMPAPRRRVLTRILTRTSIR